MRWEDEAVLDCMHARVAASPRMVECRKELVEHPFGTIKFWMNQHAFLMRGLEKVRAEFSLSALAYNIKRVLNILGLEKLLEALRKRPKTGNAASCTSLAQHNTVTQDYCVLHGFIARLFFSILAFPFHS